MQNDALFSEFCNYLTSTWTGPNVSVHGQTIRTNNSVESYHKYLFTSIGRAHPNIWMFLSKMLEVEHTKATQLGRVINGYEVLEERRRIYRLADKRIQAASVLLNSDNDVERFLRTVSHQSARLILLFDPLPGNFFL